MIFADTNWQNTKQNIVNALISAPRTSEEILY